MKISFKYLFAIVAVIIFIAPAARATDLVWIGATANWNVAGNWSPAQIPTAADNAWITNSGTYVVTVPAGSSATASSIVVGGASGSQTLAVDRATVTFSAASSINSNASLALLVAQSVVTGAGDLSVNGLLNWGNGTISGSGALNISSAGTIAIGSGGVTLGRVLNNSGAITWGGGNFTFSAGATLNNQSGGTFDITADGRLSGSAATPINNSGVFRQTAGTAGTIVTAPFNNSATLQVLASTLNLNLGGTDSSTISNALGAILNLGGVIMFLPPHLLL
jgi:trimeric autotransporter adhesin